MEIIYLCVGAAPDAIDGQLEGEQSGTGRIFVGYVTTKSQDIVAPMVSLREKEAFKIVPVLASSGELALEDRKGTISNP